MCVKPVSAAWLAASSHAIALALALKNDVVEPEELTVRTSAGNWRVVVHILPVEKPKPLNDCALDILHILNGQVCRLTTTRIMQELDKQSLLWGEATIKRALVDLVRRQLIGSSRRSPRGYWLLRVQTRPSKN